MASILLADDVILGRDLAARGLRERGHRVTVVGDGEEAVARCQRESPDAVVMDVFMPRLSGIDACARIKSTSGVHVPVILMSARHDLESRVAALAVADDFLAKPYEVEELAARIGAHLRTRRLVDELRRTRGLGVEQAQLFDSLTGLRTRAYLTERLGEEWKRSARFTEPLSLLVAGVDQRGDAAVLAVSTALRRVLRQIDILARADSDQIAALLLNTHVAGALIAAERFKRDLARPPAGAAPAAAALGIACFPGRDIAAPDDLLHYAALALERAREEGQGQICLYQHQGYLFRPGG